MVPIAKVKAGMTRFADTELCSQITGLKQIGVATAAGLLISRVETAAQKLPLGLSQGGEVDVEAIYSEACKHFTQAVPVEIPLVGTFTFTRENLDTLYNMIMGA